MVFYHQELVLQCMHKSITVVRNSVEQVSFYIFCIYLSFKLSHVFLFIIVGLLLLGFGYIGVGTAKYIYYILRFRQVMELGWGSVIGTISHASIALMIWLTATASFLVCSSMIVQQCDMIHVMNSIGKCSS
jgi:hypothetical protein